MNYKMPAITSSALMLLFVTSFPSTSIAAVLEEIQVTAQKREQNIQDVGISITAFSGDQINALGFTNTIEILQQVPGMQSLSNNQILTQLNLRGISQSNFVDSLEAPVAVYVNDTYIGSMNAIKGQLFDMERVEVLRGPQGTLFGRNATGGLVHYVTRGADDEELKGYFEIGYGRFDSYSLEGAIGGAVSNTVRGRLAVRMDKADGYIESQTGGRDPFGADSYALRASLQFDLSDNLLADVIVAYSEDDDVPGGGFQAVDLDADATGRGVKTSAPKPDPFEDFGDGGRYFRDSTSLTTRLTYNFDDNKEFISITNYLDLNKDLSEDADGTPSAITGLFSDFITISDYEQFSQEFRISGDGEAFRWQVGAYYLQIEMENEQTLTGNVFLDPPNWVNNSTFVDLESQNWSVFGQVEYDLNDQFTLIAGLRWSQDDKEIDMVVTNDTRNPDGTDDGTPPVATFDSHVTFGPEESEIDYGDYAARIQLNYAPNADQLYFVSYNRGIKGGNWSPSSSVSLETFKHDEEVLHSFELGIKQKLLDGAVRLNATLFYYDYEDYQAFSFLFFTPQVDSTDATSVGGEIELFMTPADGWDVVLGASFIDSEVDEATSVLGVTLTDNEFPNAPNYSLNGLVRYSFPALGGELALQLDGYYNGDQYLDVNNSDYSREDGYFLANARVTYSMGENWTLSGWVKNITDEDIRSYASDAGVLDLFAAPGFGFGLNTINPPRTYGITARYNF